MISLCLSCPFPFTNSVIAYIYLPYLAFLSFDLVRIYFRLSLPARLYHD